MNRIAFSFLVALLAGSAFAADLSDAQRNAIVERIKPVGESCVEGDNTCAAAPATVVSAEPRSGEAVYNAACMACHSTGAAGAPKYGDAVAWSGRIARGMPALYATGVGGVPGTGMIAKGGCMSCSDEDVYAAVDYMVAGSQ
ncbi:MAG: c-type cytochrome [Pseudomonadales bacterium]